MGIVKRPRNSKNNDCTLPLISHLLKEERVKLGYSQEALCEKLGIGLKTLRKIEQGDLNLNFKKLNRLFHFFGMELRPSSLVTSPKLKSAKKITRSEVLRILNQVFAVFSLKYGVKEMALFGSYAQGNATTDSDIDILIDLDSDINFETEGEMLLILENIFQGVKIDLTIKKNIYPAFLAEIEESKINVA